MSIETILQAEIARLTEEGKTDEADALKQEIETNMSDDKFKKFRENVKAEYKEKTESVKEQLTAVNKELAELKRKEKEAAEAESLKKGEHEKVITELKAELEELRGKTTEYEAKETERIQKIKDRLNSTIESIPEDNRKRIPELSDPEAQLQWIENNRDILGVGGKPIPKVMGAGGTPARGQKQADDEPIQPWANKKSKYKEKLSEAIEDGIFDSADEASLV